MRIHVEQEALNSLRRGLETAGEEYKKNLARLTNLIGEITSGDIQGDPATDLLNKYHEKEEAFNELAREIDKAEQYVGLKGTSFADMLAELKEKAE